MSMRQNGKGNNKCTHRVKIHMCFFYARHGSSRFTCVNSLDCDKTPNKAGISVRVWVFLGNSHRRGIESRERNMHLFAYVFLHESALLLSLKSTFSSKTLQEKVLALTVELLGRGNKLR